MSGLLDLFFRPNRRNMSDEYRAALRQIRQNRSKLYRNVRIAVILVAALAAVFFVLSILVEDLRSPISFKLTFAVIALCLGGAACLPWITQLDRDKRRAQKGEDVPKWRYYVAYGFFAFIGVCAVLWIISVFVIGDSILKNIIENNGDEIPATDFTFLRVAIIASLQAAFGSVVTTGIMRHGKNYLVLRVIMYATIAYLDIWLSWVAGGITVKGITEKTFLPISSTALWVLAVMTGVALIVSASILAGQTRRKEIELIMKGDVSALTEGDVNLIDTKASTANMYRTEEGADQSPAPAPAPAPAEASVADRLRDLKKLYDDGILTQEEYEEKKKELVSKM